MKSACQAVGSSRSEAIAASVVGQNRIGEIADALKQLNAGHAQRQYQPAEAFILKSQFVKARVATPTRWVEIHPEFIGEVAARNLQRLE